MDFQVPTVSRPGPSFLVVSRDKRAIGTDPRPAATTTLRVHPRACGTRTPETGPAPQTDSSIQTLRNRGTTVPENLDRFTQPRVVLPWESQCRTVTNKRLSIEAEKLSLQRTGPRTSIETSYPAGSPSWRSAICPDGRALVEWPTCYGAAVVDGASVVAGVAVVGVGESLPELFSSTTIATIARITPMTAPNPIPLFCVT